MLHVIRSAAAVILPGACLICGKRLWQSVICVSCTPALRRYGSRCPKCFSPWPRSEACLLCRLIPLPFGTIRYLWQYHSSARRFIRCMKYRPSPRLCRIAGRRLEEALPSLGMRDDYDLIVPLPSSRTSLCRRGFNQCELMAAELCRRAVFRGSLSTAALIHHGAHKPQASLPHARRIRNVVRSFTAQEAVVAHKTILLLDDVITTGSTSTAAALALLNAGAAGVDLLALARADAWTRFRYQIHRRVRG